VEGYAGGVSGVGILVVDDDPPIRRMLERTLVAEGYEVRTAGDGGSALVEVERAAPDLLVLDVAMPGLGGLEVCRRVRAKGLGFPVLLLTARDAVDERVAGLDAGADDYLVKPFAPAAARKTTPGRSPDSGRSAGSGEPGAEAATTVRPSKPTSARPRPTGGAWSREAVTAAIIAAGAAMA
jgi:CheY-like chemotaxis protein